MDTVRKKKTIGKVYKRAVNGLNKRDKLTIDEVYDVRKIINSEKNSIHNVRMYLHDEDDENESENCDCVRIERPFVPMNVGADP